MSPYSCTSFLIAALLPPPPAQPGQNVPSLAKMHPALPSPKSPLCPRKGAEAAPGSVWDWLSPLCPCTALLPSWSPDPEQGPRKPQPQVRRGGGIRSKVPSHRRPNSSLALVVARWCAKPCTSTCCGAHSYAARTVLWMCSERGTLNVEINCKTTMAMLTSSR